MAKSPFFSVVSVTKNNLPGLQKTLKSLESQSCSNFEWIVIDGASQDKTSDFLKQTKALWISAPDRGLYDAMNKGIERAGGTYILFLNAGDELAEPGTLARIRDKIADTRPDFIYGDALENGAYKPARPHTKYTQNMFTHHQAMLYRREAIGDLRYNLNYKIAADFDFTCRFLQSARTTLHCPIPVCNFEPGGLSQTKTHQGRYEQFKIRKALNLISPPVNAAFYIAQFLTWGFRAALPDAYWRLKSSGNRHSGLPQTEAPQHHP